MEVENQGELPEFKIVEWNAVAVWSFNNDTDTCAICRCKLLGQCLDCQSKPVGSISSPKSECKIAWGKCGHGFHEHCISRWLTTKKNCPIDMKEWDLANTEKL